MYLIGLLPLDEHKVSELVSKHINEDDQEHKRTRIVLANVSLYLSFALTNHHIPRITYFICRFGGDLHEGTLGFEELGLSADQPPQVLPLFDHQPLYTDNFRRRGLPDVYQRFWRKFCRLD